MRFFVDTPAGQRALDLFSRVLDSWNSRDLDRLKDLYAPVIVQEAGPKTVVAEIAEARAFIAAIPDLHFGVVRGVGVAEAAFVEWELTGSRGRPETGHGRESSFSIRGSSLLQVEGDRIVAIDSWFDEGLLSRITNSELSPDRLAELRTIE